MAENETLMEKLEKKINNLIVRNSENTEQWLDSGGPDKSRAKKGPFRVGPNFSSEHVLSSYDTLIELRTLIGLYVDAVSDEQKPALKDTKRYIRNLRKVLYDSLEEYISILR